MLVPSIGIGKAAGAVSPGAGAAGTNLAVAAGGGGGGGASYITPADGRGVVSTGAGAGELPFFIIFSLNALRVVALPVLF